MKADQPASAFLKNINKIASVGVVLCSVLLFLDYLLPGILERAAIQKFALDTVRGKGSTSTTYYVITNKYHFPVSADFLATANVGDTVKLEVSRILKIINSYGLPTQKEYYTYYTRYLSGIVFPLVLLLISLLSLQFKYTSERLTNLFLALNILALFFTFMTIINTSHLF